MRSFVRQFCVLALILTPRFAAIGKEPDVEFERYFNVPEGGILSYDWYDGKKGPEIYSILYSGVPEWLVSQNDARSHWHKIPTLEEVDFILTDVTPEEITYVASLKNVSSLSVTDTVFVGRALAPLAQMTWLKSLTIDFNSHLSRLESKARDRTPYEYPCGDFFKFLDKLTALESLALWPECDEATYIRICGLTNLKWLSPGELGPISDKNAALISNLTQLEDVHFENLKTPTPFLTGLCNQRRLKDLWLEATTLSTSDVELIASMSKLETLWARGKRIGSLSSLSSLANLTSLHLHFDEVGASDGCRFLAKLPNLKELVLTGVGAGDFSIENLRGHKNLTGVGTDAILRDDDIAILESMPNLKILGVGNPVKSGWFARAKRRLPGVTITGVSDSAIAP